ncbi:MAG TPA: MFS transporter [Jatrophihabitantaceae bacterium]|jgi:MFS family permease
MLGTYRAVFRTPGTAALCAAGFIMRMPMAIYPIGLVLLISTRTGHYGFAGLLSGAFVVANGVSNPILARLVDRHGQSRILPRASAVHILAVAVLCLLAERRTPDWTLLIPTAVAGFAWLAVGSLIRARWSTVLAGRPELTTAYSLESTLDEVIFTVGPLIATVIATQVNAILGLLLGVALVTVGAVWLESQHATEPPPHPAGSPKHRSAVRYPGMMLMTLAAAFMGAVFASAEVTMIAFCGQHHRTGLSGLVVACFAFGSGVAGFSYGVRTWRAGLVRRFLTQALIFAVLPVLFLAAVNVPVLAVCAFVVGLGIAPMLITGFGLIAEIVPSGALTEGMAWLTTGLSVGYGAASAVVGRIADSHGARPAFGVTIGAGVLVGALALGVYRRIARPVVESQPVAVG